MGNSNRNKVYEDFEAEAIRQDEKWGPERNHPSLNESFVSSGPNAMCYMYGIPFEERAKEQCRRAAERGRVTWAHIAIEELSEAVSEFNETKMREELVQLGAVITQWIECIDRRNSK